VCKLCRKGAETGHKPGYNLTKAGITTLNLTTLTKAGITDINPHPRLYPGLSSPRLYPG